MVIVMIIRLLVIVQLVLVLVLVAVVVNTGIYPGVWVGDGSADTTVAAGTVMHAIADDAPLAIITWRSTSTAAAAAAADGGGVLLGEQKPYSHAEQHRSRWPGPLPWHEEDHRPEVRIQDYVQCVEESDVEVTTTTTTTTNRR
jgi:hypothetical protein